VDAHVFADVTRMRLPSNNRPTFAILTIEEACRLTGLNYAQLRAERNVQELTRVLPQGRRETAVRLPAALIVNPEPT
jgi:hypothetical protein